MRDGVELIADHYEPQTSNPAGTLLVRGPYGRALPFSMLFAGGLRVAGLSRHRPKRPGHLRLRRRLQPDGPRNRRRRRHRGLAARPAVVHRFLRHHRDFLPRLHPVGAADRSAAGDEGRGHHRRPARPERPRAGATDRSGSTTFSAGATWSPTRRTRAGSAPWSGSCGRDGRWRARRAGCRSGEAAPGAARHRRAVVRVLARASRARRPVLVPAPASSGAGRAPRFRCCCSAAGRTCSSSRRWRSTSICTERGVPVAVTIGPWTHTQMMTKGAPTVIRESLGWLGHTLVGTRRHADAARCASTSTGTAGWTCRTGRPRCPSTCCICNRAGRLGDAVPPDTARSLDVHLQPGRSDAHGRRSAAVTGGRLPQRHPAGATRRRADASPATPLPADLYVVGSPVIELSHSCDNPYNDLFVRISEVDAKGRSRNVSDGYRCGTPDSGDRPHRTGRDRAPVPRRVPHPGAGRRRLASAVRPQSGHRGTIDHGRRLQPATHTVHLGEGASRLVLPAGPRLPSTD